MGDVKPSSSIIEKQMDNLMTPFALNDGKRNRGTIKSCHLDAGFIGKSEQSAYAYLANVLSVSFIG